MKIISAVGARPNFMKIAPFIKAISSHNSQLLTAVAETKVVTTHDSSLTSQSSPLITHILVHTGQHSFFQKPNIKS